MKAEDTLVKTFAKCFRLLAKFNADLRDDFFTEQFLEKSDKLLLEYINFLRLAGENTQNAAQREYHVAQYHRELASQIENLILLLQIIKHLQISELTTSLPLERELLRLRLSLLNYQNPAVLQKIIKQAIGGKTTNHQSGGNVLLKNKIANNNKSGGSVKLNDLHHQIASFIRTKERVQNSEVFVEFARITRRTIKRKLSELIKSGIIERQTKGKEVFYIISVRS